MTDTGAQDCGHSHRTWRASAACRWPDAQWIGGAGPIASVSHCRGTTSVVLCQDATDARRAIDDYGCGGGCTGRHEIVQLVREGDTATGVA